MEPREGYVTMKPWEGYMEPFRIFGNLYFVGSTHVCCHIVDTGDGLVMIDSSYPQCLYMILENMHKVGLDPKNLKYILHSHGHYDHIGGTKALIEMYGVKTVIGRGDEDYVNGKLDLTWAKELGFEYFETFDADIIMEDGDTLTIGKTTFRAVNTPGHTPGTISFVFNVDDGERTYTAGMFGGAGMNSLQLPWLDSYGLPHSLHDDFPASIAKFRKEKIDILIGNHPKNVDTAGKYKRIMNGEKDAFIDPTQLDRWLDEVQETYDKMLAEGK